MSVAIYTTGSVFYTNSTIEEIKVAIEFGNEIPIWWFTAYGQRYSEKLWVPSMEKIELLRTESDD